MKIMFITFMIALIGLSVCVSATTTSENVRKRDYDYKNTGSCATFCAHGSKGNSNSVNATSNAYTTLYNASGANLSMFVYVAEYTYDTGWSNYKSKRGEVFPGYVIATDNLNRYYNSSIKYYYHCGSVYFSKNSSTTIETYDYKANQYY